MWIGARVHRDARRDDRQGQLRRRRERRDGGRPAANARRRRPRAGDPGALTWTMPSASSSRRSTASPQLQPDARRGSPPRPGWTTSSRSIVVSDGSTDGTDEYLRVGRAAAAGRRPEPAQRRPCRRPQPRRRGGPRRPRAVRRRRRRPGPRPRRRPPRAPPPQRRRPRRDRSDAHADGRPPVAVGAVGAGHALQAVRGDAAAATTRATAGSSTPATPRSPAATLVDAGGFDPDVPASRGRRAGVPAGRRGLRFAFAPEAVVLHYAERSFDVVAASADGLRAQRRDLRPRPGQEWLLDSIGQRVPRPPPTRAGPRAGDPAAPARRKHHGRRCRPRSSPEPAPGARRRRHRRRRSARCTTSRTTGAWPTSWATPRVLLARFDGAASGHARRPRVWVRARADPRPHHPHGQPATPHRRRPDRSMPCSRRSPTRSAASRHGSPATATGRSAPGCGPAGRSAGSRRGGPLDALFVHTQVPAIALARPPAADPDRRLARRHADPVRRARRPLRPRHRQRARRAAEVAGQPGLLRPRPRRSSPGPSGRRPGLVDRYEVPAGEGHGDPAGRRLRAVGGDRRRTTDDDAGGGRPVRVLFVGGDLERKGGLRAPRCACGELRSGGVDVELDVVTRDDVPAADGVRVHHGLGPNSPELIALYHRADVFCLPTLGDCLPMVLSEAGAVGLPLVSTDVGAISEIVRHDRTGLLVPVGDAEALAAALRQLAADPSLRRRLGDEAKRRRARRLRRGDQRPPPGRPARRRGSRPRALMTETTVS